MEPIKNRYDFVMLFDCENGNPNGDPDAGNLPRVDPETQHGLVTDVCLKRKIRNYVSLVMDGVPGYQIYISSGSSLNEKDQKALNYLGIDDIKSIKKKESKEGSSEYDKKIRDFMCKNFFDIRTFGAVMTTFVSGSLNCGQVTGPVQITFAKSVDPIMPMEITIARNAITTEKDAKEKRTELGKKFIVPYGLYRAEGFISANQAQRTTGFSQEDLELLWEAITNMFEVDHSATRGKMVLRELIVFKHSSAFGNCPSHKLFDLVQVKRKENVEVPRSFDDYIVTIDEDKIPETVELQRKDV